MLLRAAEPIEGLNQMRERQRAEGRRVPDRPFCQAFGVDRSLDGTDSRSLDGHIQISEGTRLDVASSLGAASGQRSLPWRFWVDGIGRLCASVAGDL